MAKKPTTGAEPGQIPAATIGEIDTGLLLAALEEHNRTLGEGTTTKARLQLLTQVTSEAGSVHAFSTEAEKYVSRALAALDLTDDQADTHRIALRSLLRWDRAAREAHAEGLIDEATAATLTAPLDRALA